MKTQEEKDAAIAEAQAMYDAAKKEDSLALMAALVFGESYDWRKEAGAALATAWDNLKKVIEENQ